MIILISLSFPIISILTEERIDRIPNDDFLAVSDYWIFNGSVIHIDNNWSLTESTYDWCTGNGTVENPYIIENVTIDAQEGTGIIIEHTNEYFRIQNCTINNTGEWNGLYYEAGIRVSYSNNGIIHNNTIYDTEFAGISIEHTDNLNVTENKLYQNDLWGLYTNYAENSLIKNNNLNANFIDLGLIRTIDMTLKNNTLYQKGFTITADNFQQATSHNIDKSNTVNGKSIYYYKHRDDLVPDDFLNAGQIILANCSNSLVSNCAVSTVCAGIELFYSEYITIESCNFTSCAQISIHLEESYNNTLRNNRFINRYGIELRYSDENEVSNNSFYNCNRPIVLAGYCENNNISHNEIKDSVYGIYLATSCSNNKVYQNNITNCDLYGIYLWRNCDSNEIYDNKVEEGARQAIYLNNDCDSNIIRNNLILDNRDGVYLETGCDNNGIYNNTFELNGLHAFDDGINNYWNLTNIGNYWDNYTGSDLNDDNIGDTPYLISGASLSADYAPIWSDGDDPPTININSPNNDTYHNLPPTISVLINDNGRIDTQWYEMLNTSETDDFTGTSFQIDPNIWENQPEGIIHIKIFVNDTGEYNDSALLKVIKDTVQPSIIINSPLSGTQFGNETVIFNITISDATDPDMDILWYQLGTSLDKIYVTPFFEGENLITIDESLWNALDEGSVMIHFFINDTAGNTNNVAINLEKKYTPSEEGPGGQIPLGNFYIIIIIVSIVSLVILQKKRFYN